MSHSLKPCKTQWNNMSILYTYRKFLIDVLKLSKLILADQVVFI